MSRTIQFTTLAFAALVGVSAAHPGAEVVDTGAAVSRASGDVRDLDLSNNADARIAMGRVTRAAERLCSKAAATFPYRLSREFRACVNRAVGGVVTESGSRAMAALFEGNRYRRAEVDYAPLPPR